MSDRVRSTIGVRCFSCGYDFGPESFDNRRWYARLRGHYVLCRAWLDGEATCKQYPLQYYRVAEGAP